MIGYVIAGVFLLAATVWFLSRTSPALNKNTIEEQHQLEVVRERLLTQLNELDTEAGDQGLDPVVAGDEKRRLEAELAQVLRTLESLAAGGKKGGQGAVPARRAWRTALVLAILLPAAGIGIFALNNHENLAALAAYQTARETGLPPVVMEMIARLEQRLAAQPDDAVGWTRLGRSYQVLGRRNDAKAAYGRAYRLAPDNVEILSNYAAFLYSEDPANPREEAQALFRKLLKLDPDNPSALWVAGLMAHKRGEYDQAIRYWKTLLDKLPGDTPEAQQIRRALAEAEAAKTNKSEIP